MIKRKMDMMMTSLHLELESVLLKELTSGKMHIPQVVCLLGCGPFWSLYISYKHMQARVDLQQLSQTPENKKTML